MSCSFKWKCLIKQFTCKNAIKRRKKHVYSETSQHCCHLQQQKFEQIANIIIYHWRSQNVWVNYRNKSISEAQKRSDMTFIFVNVFDPWLTITLLFENSSYPRVTSSTASLTGRNICMHLFIQHSLKSSYEFQTFYCNESVVLTKIIVMLVWIVWLVGLIN